MSDDENQELSCRFCDVEYVEELEEVIRCASCRRILAIKLDQYVIEADDIPDDEAIWTIEPHVEGDDD